MHLVTIVKVIGITAAAGGLVLCWWQSFLRGRVTERGGPVKVGFLTFSGLALYKWLAFGGLFAAPAVTVAMANYHIFEGTHEVQACMRCHIMRPIGHDMIDPQSTSLAARHYRGGFIAENQCFVCHTDYGLQGSLQAKIDGFRHLVLYTTNTYEEPIVYRRRYDNMNCLRCHEGTPAFEQVQSHHTIRDRLRSSETTCLNCHGVAHPTGEERTPGHPAYRTEEWPE